MADSQDVEITLGTGRLLGLFFALVAVCAVFFGLGFTLGRSSGPGGITAEAAPLPASSTAAKPKAGNSNAPETASAPSSDLSFYKTVEQKDANPQLTPPAAPAKPSAPSSGPFEAPPPTTSAELHGTYIVQVAAVTKKEDADALTAALRKKSYPVFVASNAPTDALFHVQVGPFNDIKDAEATRSKLAGDGYNPIVKK